MIIAYNTPGTLPSPEVIGRYNDADKHENREDCEEEIPTQHERFNVGLDGLAEIWTGHEERRQLVNHPNVQDGGNEGDDVKGKAGIAPGELLLVDEEEPVPCMHKLRRTVHCVFKCSIPNHFCLNYKKKDKINVELTRYD